MPENTEHEVELERRLSAIESEELEDSVHAALSGKSLTLFLFVVVTVVVVSAIGVAL